MADETPSAEAVKEEIAREVARVHIESYGGGPTNVEVSIHDGFVAVVMDVEFTRAEQTLVDAGHEESVRVSRKSYQQAIKPTFVAIVERASGRTVTGFSSTTEIDSGRPWSVELFRLEPVRPS
jgi:uncharacterized protein YbcI